MNSKTGWIGIVILYVAFGTPKDGLAINGTMDQTFTEVPALYGETDMIISSRWTPAQTFTVGLDGLLAGVEIQVRRNSETVQDLLVQLRSADLSMVLGSASVTASQVPLADGSEIPAFVGVDLTSAAIRVHPGEVYGIILQSAEPDDPTLSRDYLWAGSGQGVDRYLAGEVFNNDSGGPWVHWTEGAIFDLGFRSYVNSVPEPGTVGLLAVGIMFAILQRRLHKKQGSRRASEPRLRR